MSLKRTIVETLLNNNGVPIPFDTLKSRLHVDSRLLYKAIEELSNAGVPIGASKTKPNGYYLIINKQDQERYAQSVQNQGVTFLKHAKNVRMFDLDNWKDNLDTKIKEELFHDYATKN